MGIGRQSRLKPDYWSPAELIGLDHLHFCIPQGGCDPYIHLEDRESALQSHIDGLNSGRSELKI